MSNLLKDLWTKATEAIEEVNKTRKLKQLQLQAEIDIANSAKSVLEKEDELNKVILKQKDSDKPSFKAIVDANESLKIAQKSHEMAIEAFKQFFGEAPKYI
jgi:TRAP-type mannitol/chloroaromatic compound transport system substrate-binding protein